MSHVENESRSDVDSVSLAKVCNKGEKVTTKQLSRRYLQGGGKRPSGGISSCPRCEHEYVDKDPGNKAARKAIRKLIKQWAKDKQTVTEFLVGGVDEQCLPVDSKGRTITDPKKIGNPSQLPKELVFVSAFVTHVSNM